MKKEAKKKETTEYGTPYVEIAKFILFNCSMGLIFDYDDETHFKYITNALKEAPEMLLHYLSDAAATYQTMREEEAKEGKRYLDISTSHLKKETLDGLQPDKWPYSYPYDAGVFITVCDDDDNFMVDLPKDLQILIKYAWNHNIQMIRLDRDAAEREELPRYDWSSM